MRESREAIEARLSTAFYSKPHLPPLDRMDHGELDSLLIFKVGTEEGADIARLVNEDFADRHGFNQPVSWSHNELWVKVQDPGEVKKIQIAWFGIQPT